ncbi:MAG TPA: glycosyltransferase [Acidimicrobiales bacterium]|nr:glycosyltransferase [Acidimicrobiales bacterium]
MAAELSVVIPAHNAEATIGAQLSALAGQQWDGEWEIVVIENGSSDRTADEVQANRSVLGNRLRLVQSDRAGASFARNLGVAETGADHIAFVDADDVVAAGWLPAMGDCLRSHEFVTGPLELDRLNPEWVARSRGRAMESQRPTFYGIFPYAHGCNFGVHRGHWEQMGGLDERMTATEDIEFSLRMWLAGIPAFFEPAAIVHYRYRTDPGSLWRQGLQYGRWRPLVARRLVDVGREPPSRVAGWKSWAHLFRQLPQAGSAEGRALLAWSAGNRIGHLIGSVEHRIVLL